MYDDFANVYDELMDNVPYVKWAEMLNDIIREEGISIPNSESQDNLESERNLVVDLACGTGTLTELMYEKGYDMIGIDSSESMLNVAYEKRDRNASEILYLNQDMRELDLYSTVGTVYCLCDGLNYLTETEDIETVFSLVHNFLYPGGLFIFDFNTVHKYRDVIGNRTIAENRDDVSFIWENTYDEENEINEYDLTVFARAELYDYNEEEQSEEKDLFRRFEEIHYQRGYSLKIMEEMLRKTGFSIVKTFDEEDSSPGDSSERIFAVARKDR